MVAFPLTGTYDFLQDAVAYGKDTPGEMDFIAVSDTYSGFNHIPDPL
jgi:hypothetical protein